MARLVSITLDPHIEDALELRGPQHAYPTATIVRAEWTLEATYDDGQVRVIRGPSHRIGELAKAAQANLAWNESPAEYRTGWDEPKLPLELAP